MASSSNWEYVITALVTLGFLVIAYFKWSFKYWHRKNLGYLTPEIPYGNINGFMKRTKHPGEVVQDMYREIKSKKWKHAGIYSFTIPQYIVTDIEYVKNVLAKDFDYFTDRGRYYNEKDDIISAHLFNLGGTKWRSLRTRLTPTFTSGKIKQMFDILVDCGETLKKTMELEYHKHEPVNIKYFLGCYTTDVIGSCAFGLDFNTTKGENLLLREMGKKAFARSRLRTTSNFVASIFPNAARALGLRVFPKDMENYFKNIVVDNINYRRNNNCTREDFFQMLLDLREGNVENGFTLNEIIAQCFVFFAAGFDTSAGTMAFTMYELARHPEIQEKVRDEIREVSKKHDGIITYEAVQDMSYLGQVIDETLRKYPPLPFVNRTCVKDYKTSDGVIIEKGTGVIIPILAIHYDEDHYPDPHKFDPDRFNPNNKSKRSQYTHLPFGEGPRICLGLRFGLLQSKMGIISLLQNYRLTVSSKTQEPLKFQVNSLTLAVEGELWVDLHKIN